MALANVNNRPMPSKLRAFADSDNIAPSLTDSQLTTIAYEALEKMEDDDASRGKWNKQVTEAFKTAVQIPEAKNSPWPGAANIKYPLILSAAMQFNSRIFPEIVQGDEIVHGKVMLTEPTQEQEDRAIRFGQHMSYQLLHGIPNWYKDTDKLLLSLSIMGMLYRKIYFNPILRRPQIDLCLPSDIIINNSVDSLENAPRITHILRLSTNDLISNMRAGLYTEYSLDELQINPDSKTNEEERTVTDRVATLDELKPLDDMHEVAEQHTFLDLDDDGYKEPYIVTFHKKSMKVLRIYARYDEDSFTWTRGSREFVCIEPIQYFNDYSFLPAPDCTYHSIGFGHYLYPLNKILNSLLNQLTDAGTLANRGGGLIARSLRMKRQNIRWKIGEFVSVEVPNGQTLGESIYPMPAKEPSATLFNLFGALLKAAQDLASISDVLQGGEPSPQTPATTVVAMIEQGSKIYSSILKRLYSSFRKEFQLLYNLNKKYLNQYDTYKFAQMTGEITLAEYKMPEYGVFPVADPSMSSEASRLAKAQALMQIIENPLVDQHEILKRYLTALQIPNIDKILPPPQPQPPSAEEIKAQAEAELTNAKTTYTKVQTHDLLMQRELEAIKIDTEEKLKEKELQIYAASQGAAATKQKIDSTIELAQAEQTLGGQAIKTAEREEEALEPVIDTQAVPPTVEQRLEEIQNMMGQAIGIPAESPPSPMSPGQAASQGVETPTGTEAPAPAPAAAAPTASPEQEMGTKIPLPQTKAVTAPTEAGEITK
jgi:chaperonin GroES